MIGTVRAVVLDFDGLLMDTESTNVASWEHEWAHWGRSLDLATFFVPHGGDVTEARYDRLAAVVGADFDRAASRERRTRERDRLNAELTPAEGIEPWLDHAGELGLRVAVASSSPRTWVTRHLDRVGLQDAFEVVVGGDEVGAHKPAPDVYLEALGRLDLTPSEAVAVEDTPHGVDAAHAAGLACIAIPNPYVDPALVGHADLTLVSAADRPLDRALLEAVARAGEWR